MALFTDGTLATLSDLRQYEHSIVDVAQTEGIDLAEKLALSQREIGLEIAAFLLKKGAPLPVGRDLSNVVVTEALIHWHAVHTLAICYRDAYNSQMNDRHRGKWEDFARLATRSQRLATDIGVGIALSPVPPAAAPKLNVFPGGLLPRTTYYVAVAWLGRQNCSGGWSEAVALTVDPGMRFRVTIPTPPSGLDSGVVYAGTSESALTRQSELPVAAPGEWVLPLAGLVTSLPNVRVQVPDYYVSNRREMLRG